MAGASAAAVAGVVIGGLAVGVAIGTALRKLFGEAKAVRAEEAAVQLDLARRRFRDKTEQELGRKLTQPEVRAIFDATIVHLENLGFEQKANGQWHRPRSAVERFFG